jgi:hypothetical protein
VPGLGALDTGGNAEVLSVSCGAAGNCAAGGFYWDRRGNAQGFVAAERNSRWGTAIEVPGLGALNTEFAEVTSVSCASAGTCAAGGTYTDRRGHYQGFVVSQRHGRWGTAAGVPGLGALNTGGAAAVLSVSCGSAGNCAAGGRYYRRGHYQGFVVSQRHGRWGTATGVPGLGALRKRGTAEVSSVSCARAGNCAAGGYYTDHRGNAQGFVAAERNGRWGTAIEVPRALNTEFAQVTSVSCASAGTCAAGGTYTDHRGHQQGFVISERHGRWGTATGVPGLGALNTGGTAEVLSVSCASAGTCAAGGEYADRHHHPQVFVADERNGRWGTAIEVPGMRTLNASGNAEITILVSCAPAGPCAAGGDYWDRRGHPQGFVVSQAG